MAHLVYGLNNNEAIILITGPIGSGKTMCLQSFLSGLGSEYHFALVTNTQVTHVELLKLILDDLGIQLDPHWDKSDLLIAFKDYLIESRKLGKKIVVVIDEAQNLGAQVLEEVRLLTNLGQGSDQLVQLILVGQPELQDILDRPELAQLRQRIRVHYQVEKLSFEEMVGYVEHRLAVSGCRRRIFEPDAFMRLFQLSGGVPRLVNTHAGNALLSAFVAQREMVTVQDVEEGVTEDEGGQSAVTPDVASVPKAEPSPASKPKLGPVSLPAFEQEPHAEAPDVIPPPSAEEEEVPLPSPPPSEPVTGETPAQGQNAAFEAGMIDAEEPREEKKKGRKGLIWTFLVLLVLSCLAVWYTQFPESFPWQPSTPILEPVSVTDVGSGESPADTGLESIPPQVEADAAMTDSLPAVGVAQVSGEDGSAETTVPTPREEEIPVVPPVHFIHVASFINSERSQADLDRFQEMGFRGLVKKEVVNQVEWYRVYLGPFESHEEALANAGGLLEKGTIGYYMIVEHEASPPAAENVAGQGS